jgi:hypothetical protein
MTHNMFLMQTQILEFNLKKKIKPFADSMVLKYVVTCGASPRSIASEDFKEIIRAVAEAGPNYTLPDRHAFGADTRNSPDGSGLGRVLVAELARAKIIKEKLMDGVENIGGTLVHDGAKWRHRNLLNSALQTSGVNRLYE